MSANSLSSGLIAGVALLVSTQVSFAIDADDFTRKILGYMESGGYEIGYASATSSGDDVTIEGISAGIDGIDGTVQLDSLTFEGVREDGDGGYDVRDLKPFDFTYTVPADGDNPAMDLSVSGITATNIHVPGGEAFSTPTNMMIAETASTGPVDLSVDGNRIFSAAGLQSTTRQSDDGAQLKGNFSLDGLKFDLATIPYPKARQVLSAMGYEQVEGDITGALSWNLADGTMEVSEYLTDLSGVGKLNFTFSISGYTLQMIKDMQKMQAQMAAAADDANAQQAMGLAAMGLLQQLTLNSIAIRFDDASVTDKVLGFIASQQGMSIDQFVQGLKGMMPLYLAALQNPEFQQKVTTAVGEYLDHPKNIEISAVPQSPLPFATIVGTGMGAPQTLPDVLNVDVTANR